MMLGQRHHRSLVGGRLPDPRPVQDRQPGQGDHREMVLRAGAQVSGEPGSLGVFRR